VARNEFLAGGPVLHALRACELAPSVLRCSPGFHMAVVDSLSVLLGQLLGPGGPTALPVGIVDQ